MSCLIVFVLGSCEKEEEEVLISPSETDILGTWSLTQTEGGLSGIISDYSAGEFTMDFLEDEVVVVNASFESKGGIPSGTYPYALTMAEENVSLRIGEDGDPLLPGTFSYFGDRFTIDQRFFDGALYTFVRN